MNVVTPSAAGNLNVSLQLNNLAITGNLKYSPLPRALRNPDDYKGESLDLFQTGPNWIMSTRKINKLTALADKTL